MSLKSEVPDTLNGRSETTSAGWHWYEPRRTTSPKATFACSVPQTYFQEHAERGLTQGKFSLDHARATLITSDGNELSFPFSNSNLPNMLLDQGVPHAGVSGKLEFNLMNSDIYSFSSIRTTTYQSEIRNSHYGINDLVTQDLDGFKTLCVFANKTLSLIHI